MKIDERKPHPNSRQSTVELLDIGESYSVSRRVDMTFGINQNERRAHAEQVRNILDSLATRAKKKFRGREFLVESVQAVSQHHPGLLFIAICTRTK